MIIGGSYLINKSIIIGLMNADVSEKLKMKLVSEGYEVLHVTNSGNDLIREVRKFSPTIVIMGYKLADMTIMDVYNRIGSLARFLAIVNEPYKSYVQEETDIFCISSPINNIVLFNSLDMIIQSERRVNKLIEKVSSLEQKIEERKLVEKAKGILMKEKSISEEEAFRFLQKKAMDTKKTLKAIADEVLQTN